MRAGLVPHCWPRRIGATEEVNNLFLWRHAEAEDGSPDLARALTKRGRAQAADVAEWLRKALPGPASVMASPAARAIQTADALGLAYKSDPRLSPDSTAIVVINALGLAPGRDQSVETLVAVGHQPWVGEVAAYLLTGEISPWSVRKCAVWWLSRRERSGASSWTLRAVVDAQVLDA